MTYRIHFTLPDGTEDSIVLSGDTVEDIRAQADIEVARRSGTNPWSEAIGSGRGYAEGRR